MEPHYIYCPVMPSTPSANRTISRFGRLIAVDRTLALGSSHSVCASFLPSWLWLMRSSSVHRPWSFACISAVQRVAASSLQSTPHQVRMRARTCGNQFASFGDCWTGPDANHKQKAKIIIIKSQSLLGKRDCCFDAVFCNGFVRFYSLLSNKLVGKWTFFRFRRRNAIRMRGTDRRCRSPGSLIALLWASGIPKIQQDHGLLL